MSMTAIRDLTETSEELRELTVDEENMVAGGNSFLAMFGIGIRRIPSGETCISVQSDVGAIGFCYW